VLTCISILARAFCLYCMSLAWWCSAHWSYQPTRAIPWYWVVISRYRYIYMTPTRSTRFLPMAIYLDITVIWLCAGSNKTSQVIVGPININVLYMCVGSSDSSIMSVVFKWLSKFITSVRNDHDILLANFVHPCHPQSPGGLTCQIHWLYSLHICQILFPHLTWYCVRSEISTCWSIIP